MILFLVWIIGMIVLSFLIKPYPVAWLAWTIAMLLLTGIQFM